MPSPIIDSTGKNVPLPMSLEELNAYGFDVPDFVLVTGDAYIDHPSFGTAIIGRVLLHHGYSVGIIAPSENTVFCLSKKMLFSVNFS